MNLPKYFQTAGSPSKCFTHIHPTLLLFFQHVRFSAGTVHSSSFLPYFPPLESEWRSSSCSWFSSMSLVLHSTEIWLVMRQTPVEWRTTEPQKMSWEKDSRHSRELQVKGITGHSTLSRQTWCWPCRVYFGLRSGKWFHYYTIFSYGTQELLFSLPL